MTVTASRDRLTTLSIIHTTPTLRRAACRLRAEGTRMESHALRSVGSKVRQSGRSVASDFRSDCPPATLRRGEVYSILGVAAVAADGGGRRDKPTTPRRRRSLPLISTSNIVKRRTACIHSVPTLLAVIFCLALTHTSMVWVLSARAVCENQCRICLCS